MRILVIGAYGYTGKLICKEFEKEKIQYSVAGRNGQELDRLKNRYKLIDKCLVLDIRNLPDVSKVIENSDLIVNCAGPFTEESGQLLERIADSGNIYLDITGELEFVRFSKEKFHQRAIRAGSLIVHGCAFESLLADLAIQFIASSHSIHEVKTLYSFNQNRVSPGTRMTMKLARYRDTLRIKNGEWTSSDLVEDQLKVSTDSSNEQIGIPYSLPEIAFAKWNYNVKSAESFLLLAPAEARFISRIPVKRGNSLDELDEIRLRKSKGPTDDERAEHQSLLVVNENSFKHSNKLK